MTNLTNEEVRKEIVKFYDEQPRGAEYSSLQVYLTEHNIEIPQINLSSHVGVVLQQREIIQVGVSKEIYKGWFGGDPKSFRGKDNLFNVNFSKKYAATAEELKAKQQEYATTEMLRQGVTPSLEKARLGVREMEILSEIGLTRTFLNDVLLLDLKENENYLNLLRIQGQKYIVGARDELARKEEELNRIFDDLIKLAYQKHGQLIKTLNGQEKKIKEIDQKTTEEEAR
jgi:hypothetical protein